MHIVFFAHPLFLRSQSMRRYAEILSEGMRKRGHTVEVWAPSPYFFRLPILKKWFGYIDQYIIFPLIVKRRMAKCPKDTLFVFTDHALGPWVPIASDRKHIIHCHDFLAQRSALDEIPENRTSRTGKLYQSFIRKGYKKGRNFISISNKTQEDLHRFLGFSPELSEVVYNGQNRSFSLDSVENARTYIREKTGIEVNNGYLLHVGGNQWYKNRRGVIEIYNAWRKKSGINLPLLMIGFQPSASLKQVCEQSPYKEDIHWLISAPDDLVRQAYVGASIFLFPSLSEGFGWPIIEAMASGTLVITTNEAPMTEVAGDAAFLIDRRPRDGENVEKWAIDSAEVVDRVFKLPDADKKVWVNRGLENTRRFDMQDKLDEIESIYKKIT